MEKRKVFVLGDSVSIYYGPDLKHFLEDKAQYDRKRGLDQALKDLDNPVGANGGDSRMVLDYLKEEKEKGTKYDILLFNCGLHDIRVDRELHKIQVDLEEYENNLKKICTLVKEMSRKAVWVSLTPIVDEIHNSRKTGFLRFSKDAENYNAAANKIMISEEIFSIDLYNFTKVLGSDIYFDHVHFNKEVRRLQAAFIAGALERVLEE